MSKFVYPYVYICTHKVTKQFYIGYRESNKEPSYIDFPKYKTSSKFVEPIFEEFNWQIIAEFFDGKSAYDFEQYLIYTHWDDPLLINQNCHYNKKRFRNTVGLRGKDNPNFGKDFSKETRRKMSKAKQGKLPPNFDSWARAAKGKSYYHNTELCEEKRFLPSEVPAGWTKGRLKITCSCGKQVDISNLKRHHKNCP